MSDSFDDPLKPPGAGGGANAQSAVAIVAVAIVSRDADAADALWAAIGEDPQRRTRAAFRRADRDAAIAILYLSSWEDFADEESCRRFAAEISRDTAAMKLVLEPLTGAAAETRERFARMVAALGDSAKIIGTRKHAKQDRTVGPKDGHAQAWRVRKALNAAVGGQIAPADAAPSQDPSKRAKRDRPARVPGRARREGRPGGERKMRSSGAAAQSDSSPERRSRAAGTKRPRSRSADGKGDTRPVRPAKERPARPVKERTVKKRSPRPAGERKVKERPARTPRQAVERKPKERPPRQPRGTVERKPRERPQRRAERSTAPVDRAVQLASERRRPPRPERKRRHRGADGSTAPGDQDFVPIESLSQGPMGDDVDAAPLVTSRRPASVPATDRPLAIAIKGLDDALAARLRAAIERQFGASGVSTMASPFPSRASVMVYGFDGAQVDVAEIRRRGAQFAAEKSSIRIFLERVPAAGQGDGPADLENREIAGLANAMRGTFVERQKPLQRMADPADRDALDAELMARAVAGVCASRRIQGRKFAPHAFADPADLIEARRIAQSPADFLAQLSWSASWPPKTLRTALARPAVEAFADSAVLLPNEQTLDLASALDWATPLADRRSEAYRLGLEFLVAPLHYWYCKANGRASDESSQVDASLKQRAMTASALLNRAGDVIVHFLGKQPLDYASPAWTADVIARRISVMTLFVMCCKTALKRRIKFDEAACGTVLCGLFDLLETMRSDDFYAPCAIGGIAQDCGTIAAALALRGTAYGERLLQDSLGRLRSLQLDPGLTSDGVWHDGPFAVHCSVVWSLTTLVGDLAAVEGVSFDAVTEALKKMTVFTEAMLKSNGFPLPIDESRSRSFAEILAGARRALSLIGARKKMKAPARGMTSTRITETYVFRDAQYFVSHSAQQVTADSSQVVLHAEKPSLASGDPGGMVLAFAHGPTDLLIRAQPSAKGNTEAAKAQRYDSALRNGFHVDGLAAPPPRDGGGRAARIVKSWRGPGWAAARCLDDVYAGASVSRSIVHLKSHHALLVVDELATEAGGEAEFEQFWHVSSAFAAARQGEAAFDFVAPENGHLTVAFDAQHEGGASIEPSGQGPCLRRRTTLARGVLASLFQWTADANPATLVVARAQEDDWLVAVSCAGFDGRVMRNADAFRVEPAGGPS